MNYCASTLVYLKRNALFLTLIGVFLVSGSAWADDWPMQGHDAAHTFSTLDTIRLPLVLSWMKALPADSPATGFALADHSWFVLIRQSANPQTPGPLTLMNFSPLNGDLKWSQPVGEGVVGFPLITNGKVYIASYDSTTQGALSVYSAQTGKAEWGDSLPADSIDTNLRPVPSPIAFDGQVYLPGKDGNILRWNADTGQPLPPIATGLASAPGVSTPLAAVSVGDQGVFATARANGVYGHEAGAPPWTASVEGAILLPPTASGSYLFVASGGASPAVTTFSIDDGHPFWSNALDVTGMAEDFQHLYVAETGGKVLQYDPFTGFVQWVWPGKSVPTGLIALGGRVIVGGSDGRLTALNSDTGFEQWSFTVPPLATPTRWFLLAASGANTTGETQTTLYAMTEDGLLMKFTPGTYGDLTGDQQVTVADAIQVLRSIVGLAELTPEQRAVADVAPSPGPLRRPFGDGKIDVTDVLSMLRKAVGLQPPSWPFPS
jgi:outer membrane protein assembly factor BamB